MQTNCILYLAVFSFKVNHHQSTKSHSQAQHLCSAFWHNCDKHESEIHRSEKELFWSKSAISAVQELEMHICKCEDPSNLSLFLSMVLYHDVMQYSMLKSRKWPMWNNNRSAHVYHWLPLLFSVLSQKHLMYFSMYFDVQKLAK